MRGVAHDEHPAVAGQVGAARDDGAHLVVVLGVVVEEW